MRALITGITGFAGSFLAEHLLQSGDEVMGASRSARWGAGVPVELASDISLLNWDVTQEISDSARSEIESFAPEGIFHLAAISTPADCGGVEPNAEAVATNVDGTRRVVDLALSLPEPPRLLLTSSCHVYKTRHDGSTDLSMKTASWHRTAHMEKRSWAPRLKSAKQWNGACKLLSAVPSITPGPRQSPRMVLPDWVRQFAKTDGSPIRVQTMDAYLDLADVRDIVAAYRHLMLQGLPGEAYNIGTGKCRRSGDIFNQLLELADPDRKVEVLAQQVIQQPIADITKIRRDTDWKPEITLKKTLADTLAFLAAEVDWYRGSNAEALTIVLYADILEQAFNHLLLPSTAQAMRRSRAETGMRPTHVRATQRNPLRIVSRGSVGWQRKKRRRTWSCSYRCSTVSRGPTTSTTRPDSSRHSRIAACSAVSPGSTLPPGNSQ